MQLLDRMLSRRRDFLALADNARDARRWHDAVRLYQRALGEAPCDPSIWIQLGHALKESGGLREARKLAQAEIAYRRAISLGPANPDAYLQLGHVLKLQGHQAEASKAYRKSLLLAAGGAERAQRSPVSAALPPGPLLLTPPATADDSLCSRWRRRQISQLLKRGDQLRDAGNWLRALIRYRAALTKDAQNAAVWLRYGDSLAGLANAGDRAALPRAEDAYWQALIADPNCGEAYLKLGRISNSAGRTEQARLLYLNALLVQPSWEIPRAELEALPAVTTEAADLAARDIEEFFDPASSDQAPLRQRDTKPRPLEAPQEIMFPAATALPPTPRKFCVLYLSGDSETPSHRYRVQQPIEALAAVGIEAEYVHAEDLPRAASRLRGASLLVIFRLHFDDALDRLIQMAASLNVPVVYDIDDYIFEPSIAFAGTIDAMRGWDASKTKEFHSEVRRYRAALLSCQFATFTTPYLVARGRELGRQSFLVPNMLGYASLRGAERAVSRARATRKDGLVRLGYATGTRTHQRDFAQCATAVAKILHESPECRLVLFLDRSKRPLLDLAEFPGFRGLEGQIEWRDFVAFDDVAQEMARFDINLAPVEVGNGFCEAKSDLKYFEAACLGIPTVASATAAFRQAIAQSRTGYLAAAEEDWYAALTALVRDSSLRMTVGEAARRHAADAYHPAKHAARLQQVYGKIIRRYRTGLGRNGSALTVVFLLPRYIAGSSHFSAVVQLAKSTADCGHDVELHLAENSTVVVDELRRVHDLRRAIIVSSQTEPLRACDVAVCSNSVTAFMLHRLRAKSSRQIYWVYDDEPLTVSGAEAALAAKQSYRLGLPLIPYGRWVDRQLRGEPGYEDGWRLPLFVDKSVFFADESIARSSTRIVVYLESEGMVVQRNLVVAALYLMRNEYRFNGSIEFFGSEARLDLSFDHIWHGVLNEERMAALFREATVGVALAIANPLPIALGMMACGLPVIDLDCNEKAASYGSEDSACLVPPDARRLADAMLRLMTDAAAQQTLAARASRFAQALPDVSAAGAVFARLLIRSLAVPDRQVMAEAAPAHRPGNPGHGTGGCLLPA